MKVYEKLNKLKGTKATMEQIYNWAYNNRILPCEIGEELELKDKSLYNEKLQALSESVEQDESGLKKFLNMEEL